MSALCHSTFHSRMPPVHIVLLTIVSAVHAPTMS